MTLGELVEELKKRNPSTVVKNGFGSGHSDRGDYANAAFSPVGETTFGDMLKHATDLIYHYTPGYKGGDSFMGHHVEALIGEWGSCGEIITSFNFKYWDSPITILPTVKRLHEVSLVNELLRTKGCGIADIFGHVSDEFGDPVFKLTRILLSTGKIIDVEGEHDLPYISYDEAEFASPEELLAIAESNATEGKS